MVGSGRSFEEVGFFTKLDSVQGYVCADILKFPKVPVFVVPTDIVRSLYRDRRLGAGTRISSATFYSTVVPLLPPPVKVAT